MAERQLADYQERLGKPFLHGGYMDELTALRDQLKTALSDKPAEAEGEKGPSAAEVAEKIKALRVSHQVEAAPVRVKKKAEQPKPVPVPPPVVEEVEQPKADEPPPEDDDKPVISFRTRVKPTGSQMTLF